MLKGADIILIPEIPYNVDEVLNTIRKREKQGKKFTEIKPLLVSFFACIVLLWAITVFTAFYN